LPLPYEKADADASSNGDMCLPIWCRGLENDDRFADCAPLSDALNGGRCRGYSEQVGEASPLCVV